MFSNTSKITTCILLASIGLVLLMQLHNLLAFPISRGYDASGHTEYISYLKAKGHIPLPYEGWELWQPPLYYAISALMPTLVYTKVIGLVMWLLLSCACFLFYQKRFKELNIALAGFSVTASLPVVLYLSYSISNEFFSAVLISCTLILYCSYLKINTRKSQVLLGILLGLSIITKSTAFIVLLAILVDRLLVHRDKLRSVVKELLIPFLLTTLIGGWFYIRNILLFGNPLIASFDFPAKHPLTQPVVQRSLEFFTTLKGFLLLDLFKAHHYSFLAGTYFSWFYDGQNIIVPVQEFSKIGIVLILFSLPIFLFSVIGFLKECKVRNNPTRVLVIYSILLFISYILYNFRLPFYSTVKGAFIVSAIIPFVYFFLRGIIAYKNHLLLIALYLFLYTAVIVKVFWILKFWYSGT